MFAQKKHNSAPFPIHLVFFSSDWNHASKMCPTKKIQPKSQDHVNLEFREVNVDACIVKENVDELISQNAVINCVALLWAVACSNKYNTQLSELHQNYGENVSGSIYVGNVCSHEIKNLKFSIMISMRELCFTRKDASYMLIITWKLNLIFVKKKTKKKYWRFI